MVALALALELARELLRTDADLRGRTPGLLWTRLRDLLAGWRHLVVGVGVLLHLDIF